MESRRHYDNVYRAGIWTEEKLDPRRLSKLGLILKKLRLERGEILLDLGCGNGRYSKFFSLRGTFVIGLDISKLALDLTKEQCMQCDFVLGTAEKLPFKDGVFDKIFAMDVIEHVRNDLGCLNEIMRTVKNSGTIFVSFPREQVFKFPHDSRLGHLHVYQKDNVKKFLEKNDLTTEIYFVDAIFDYICYHLELVLKRILTREKEVDSLKSSIKNGNPLVYLGKKILTFLALLDLVFCKCPLGNTLFVFAKKEVYDETDRLGATHLHR